MTNALISLDAGKEHLRVDHSLDDSDIQSKILEASLIVLDFLKLSSIPSSWSGGTGSTNTPTGNTVPENVQAVVKLILGELYRNRDAGTSIVLSQTVKDLLRRLRDPALA